MSLVWATLYIYMMSRFPTPLAVLAVIIIELFLVVSIAACFYQHGRVNSAEAKKSYLIAGIIFAVLLLIFNCMLWCYRSSFAVAIAVVDASADFLASTKRLILVSVVYFIMALIVVSIWVTGMVFITSVNEVVPKQNYAIGLY